MNRISLVPKVLLCSILHITIRYIGRFVFIFDQVSSTVDFSAHKNDLSIFINSTILEDDPN